MIQATRSAPAASRSFPSSRAMSRSLMAGVQRWKSSWKASSITRQARRRQATSAGDLIMRSAQIAGAASTNVASGNAALQPFVVADADAEPLLVAELCANAALAQPEIAQRCDDGVDRRCADGGGGVDAVDPRLRPRLLGEKRRDDHHRLALPRQDGEQVAAVADPGVGDDVAGEVGEVGLAGDEQGIGVDALQLLPQPRVPLLELSAREVHAFSWVSVVVGVRDYGAQARSALQRPSGKLQLASARGRMVALPLACTARKQRDPLQSSLLVQKRDSSQVAPLPSAQWIPPLVS